MKPYYNEDIKQALEKLYYPKNVDDISDMDETMIFLVAINNKGFNASEVRINEKVMMSTLDEAIKNKDLYYLEITIKANTLDYCFYKYPKSTSGQQLITSKKPFKFTHRFLLFKLSKLLKMYDLQLKAA